MQDIVVSGFSNLLIFTVKIDSFIATQINEKKHRSSAVPFKKEKQSKLPKKLNFGKTLEM